MAKKKAKRKTKPEVKPIAVITADTHLHPTTWTNRPTLRGDSFNAFSQIREYCVQHQIYDLIIAGDVLDRRVNDAETPGFIRKQMRQLHEHNVRISFIQGQHDLQAGRAPWLESMSDWPLHMSRTTRFIDKYRIRGLDWTRPSELEEAMASIPEDTDILIMHQVCTEFMGGVRDCELTCATVPHAKLLIMGDYHVHETQTLRMADGRKMLLVSPGSTCIQKIDEEPAKQFFVLHSDLTVTSHPIKGRRVISARGLLTHDAVDDFVENVEEAIEEAVYRAEHEGLASNLLKPLLRVEYASDLEGASRRIRRAVGPAAFLFEKQLVAAQASEEDVMPMTGTEARDVMEKSGLSGFLPRVLDRKRERKLYSFCSELLDSQEPLEVIQAWRDKAGLTQEAGVDD